MTQKLQGEVVSVSEGGDLITSIRADDLEIVPRDDTVTIAFDGHKTSGIFGIEHDEPEMTLIALIGQNACLEIRLVGESVHAFLGVGVGASVTVEW